jgi:hypothetical protein
MSDAGENHDHHEERYENRHHDEPRASHPFLLLLKDVLT